MTLDIDDIIWKFRRKTADHIAKHGRTIVGVAPCEGDDGNSFSYTIGNHLKGLPELLIIGSSNAPYLNDLSRLMIARGGPFEDGELVKPLMVMLPFKMIRVHDIRAWNEYTVQAGNHFGHDDYGIMQAVLSDKEGRFPGEAGCKKPWSEFPILRGS